MTANARSETELDVADASAAEAQAEAAAAPAPRRLQALDYDHRRTVPAECWSPMSRWFAATVVLAATWPGLATLTVPLPRLPNIFGFFVYGFLIVISVISGVFVACSRWVLVKPMLNPTGEAERLAARRRWQCVLFAAVSWGAHATGLPFRVLFLVHYPLFHNAATTARATMLPQTSKPHGRVGLFPVSAIQLGTDGEVGFRFAGDGITFDPTPATREWFFVPPDDEGQLLPQWYWTVTD